MGENKPAVDASDTGAGAVLPQEDCNGVVHPVSYHIPAKRMFSGVYWNQPV